MEKLNISHHSKQLDSIIPLPSSKSESNRVLIMQALAKQQITLENLAEARDTQTMIRLLQSSDEELNVLDAGTTMRFLTAYCTVIGRKTVLTGTERMQQRPIKILVEALRELGADIEYLNKEGYPPIQINGFQQSKSELAIRGDVSSQYISALLMVAPTLPKGLQLQLTGHIGSMPYIEMTLKLMAHFGISYDFDGKSVSIAPQDYQANHYTVESDWSGASYWFSMVALAEKADVKLLNLRKGSYQGDQAIVEIMDRLGVAATYDSNGIKLTKKAAASSFYFDFTHCPDLAQTVAVVCAAKGIDATLKGLESLRIKETDRISAIAAELKKFGVEVTVKGDSEVHIPAGKMTEPKEAIHTYEDHRMAMAFAPLALLFPLIIEEPSVVNKSYPSFWSHLSEAGFDQRIIAS